MHIQLKGKERKDGRHASINPQILENSLDLRNVVTETSDMRSRPYISIKTEKSKGTLEWKYFSCSRTTTVYIHLRLSLLGTRMYCRGHKNSVAKKRQKDLTLQFPFKIETHSPLATLSEP